MNSMQILYDKNIIHVHFQQLIFLTCSSIFFKYISIINTLLSPPKKKFYKYGHSN